MNERWKELIKQAIQEIGTEDNSSKEETLKRFAELIAEECLGLCEDERDIRAIKDHFGVE